MRLRRPVCPHKLRWHSVQALEEISAEVTRKRDSAHPLSKIAESRSSHPQLKVMLMVVPSALRTVWPSRSRCHVSRNKIGMTPRCHISHLSPAKASIIYITMCHSPPPSRSHLLASASEGQNVSPSLVVVTPLFILTNAIIRPKESSSSGNNQHVLELI